LQPRANRIIEMNKHDQNDPKRHVDETRKRADRVERLRHDDVSRDRTRDIAVRFFPDELRAFGIDPCGVEARAEDHDIDPIDEKGRAVREEIGQEPGREREHGDDAKKKEMQPGEVAI
jgi:hypothetical protein